MNAQTHEFKDDKDNDFLSRPSYADLFRKSESQRQTIFTLSIALAVTLTLLAMCVAISIK